MNITRDELAVAIATAALVPSIFGSALPPLSEVRGTPRSSWTGEHQADALATATWKAGALVAAIAAVSGSPVVAGLGVLAVVIERAGYSRALGCE